MQFDGAELAIMFLATDCGEPHRPRRRDRLAAGTWIRVIYNGHFRAASREAPLIYGETVVDIAFRVPPRANMFAGKPPHAMNVLADLW